MTTVTVHTRTDPLGEFTLRTIDPQEDAARVHAWVTHPKSVFYLMTEATHDDVVRELETIAARPGHDAYLGLHDGAPAFLAERYDPAHELGDVYPVQPGDVGMHFLVAPAAQPVHGFTRAVIVTVMDMLFADPDTRRVVVEPDVRNTAVHALNAYVGFEVVGTVSLPQKDALLSVCTREAYHAARAARAAQSAQTAHAVEGDAGDQ